MTTVKYTIMIGEILQKVDDAKTKKAKKDILIKYSEVKDLKHYLRGLFDPKVQWAINEEPDYKPDIVTPEGEEANSLYVEMPLCSIFVKGHKACENLKQALERSDPDKKNKGAEAARACQKLLYNTIN